MTRQPARYIPHGGEPWFFKEWRADVRRGFDNGVFIPLKVALPRESIPTLQLSIDASLDAGRHLAIGRALAPLRDDGVLIVGSGMSFHNRRRSCSGAPLSTARAPSMLGSSTHAQARSSSGEWCRWAPLFWRPLD